MRHVLSLLVATLLPLAAQSGKEDREFTVQTLDRIARPVIGALAEGKLKQQLPLGPGEKDRAECTPLEAFGRTLAGISPWLALGPDDSPEGKLRAKYITLSRKALVMATDPASPDRMNFSKGGQPLVDAAFLSQALLQATEASPPAASTSASPASSTSACPRTIPSGPRPRHPGPRSGSGRGRT